MKLTKSMEKAMWEAYAASKGYDLDHSNTPRDIRDARPNVSTDVALIERGLRLTSDKILWERHRVNKVNKLTEAGVAWIGDRLAEAEAEAIVESRDRETPTVVEATVTTSDVQLAVLVKIARHEIDGTFSLGWQVKHSEVDAVMDLWNLGLVIPTREIPGREDSLGWSTTEHGMSWIREVDEADANTAILADAPQGHPDGSCGDWTCPECGDGGDAMDAADSGSSAAELRATYEIFESGATDLRSARPMYIGTDRVTAQMAGTVVSVFVGLKLMYNDELPSDLEPGSPDFYAWVRGMATSVSDLTPADRARRNTLAYLARTADQGTTAEEIPNRVVCETWDCDALATDIVTLTGNPPAVRTEHCRQHAIDLSESPFFASMEAIRLSIPAAETATVWCEAAGHVGEHHSTTDCIHPHYTGRHADRPAADTRAMAASLRGQTVRQWTADDCDHVPPLVGCWCALLRIGHEAPTPTGQVCMATDYECLGPVTAYLACCSTPVCSPHAVDSISGPCPACGSVMSAPLAAFDAAMATLDTAIIRADELVVDLEAELGPPLAAWVAREGHDAYQSHPERSGDSRPDDESLAAPTFGVVVEWWDEDRGMAMRAVIGSHETWEIAVGEMARIKRLDRFDHVTSTIALYPSVEAF